MSAVEKILFTDEHKKGLKLSLLNKAEVFSFEEEPQLASLLASLGIAFELENSAWDRLSFALGLSEKKAKWKTEIISRKGEFGLRATHEGIDELRPKHVDFASLLDPLSINEEGCLASLVLFPMKVTRHMKNRGIEAVIVKDWVLSSFLATDNERQNYQLTNEDEIRKNIAHLQSELMFNQQLALSGTHDLVDHVLGVDGEVFKQRKALFQRAKDNLGLLNVAASNTQLIVSYFIGVLSDDLAQSQWYQSEDHVFLLEKSLSFLEFIHHNTCSLGTVILPRSFHVLVAELRKASGNRVLSLEEAFDLFMGDLVLRKEF